MPSSIEEALSVFRKWKVENSQVCCLLKLLCIGGMLEGAVFRVDSNSLTILPHGSPDPRFGLITVSLTLVPSISFIDPRSAIEFSITGRPAAGP
jgi:hypothetical protein